MVLHVVKLSHSFMKKYFEQFLEKNIHYIMWNFRLNNLTKISARWTPTGSSEFFSKIFCTYIQAFSTF